MMTIRPPTSSGHIYLIGFSGSGKSTVGEILARRLKLPFYDADSMIEEKDGRKITDIFEQSGERIFRSLETNMIKTFGVKYPFGVVALGGGAFQKAANRQSLFGSGLVVFLSCSIQEIYRRLMDKVDRPRMNIRPRKSETLREARIRRISMLLSQRMSNYRKADLVISTTDRTPAVVVKDLMPRIRRYYADGFSENN